MAQRRSNPVNRHWTGFSSSALALAAGGVCSMAQSAQHDRETILRTRGQLLCYADGVQTPGALTVITAGLILVPEGTGATELWSPFTDADAPWFWYVMFMIGHEEAVTDVIGNSVVAAYRETIDSKAMRRVRNQEVQFCVENTTLGGAISVNIGITGRFLSQE